MKFNELIKNPDILKVIEEIKYDTATEIQEKTIPLLLNGKDVLGQSKTGTGKTWAFALPILERMKDNKKLQVIIISPTRELAIQIEREIAKLTKYMKVNTVCVYGSSSIEDQARKIKKGVEIVVGTPGRVKDLIKRNILQLNNISYFVLDEADEMLSMGFKEDIEFIFKETPSEKQVMLFSATMPKDILNIAKNYMKEDYEKVIIKSDDKTSENISQETYIVTAKTKAECFCRIMDNYNPQKCIVFCRTKRNVDELLEKLIRRNLTVEAIHGDITQAQRIATLDKFNAGYFNYLIATDVAARGIHVNNVDIVVNYNLPENSEMYIHRIGRTGRASESGLAISLITKTEEKTLERFKHEIKTSIVRKEIPTKEVIIENNIKNVIESLSLENKESLFNDYLDKLSNDELKNILNNLLIDKMNKSLSSNFDTELTEEKSNTKRKRENNADRTRLFLTIGKMDKIEKRDLLSLLEKKAGLKEGLFSGLEVLSKFSFVNIDNKHLETFLKKCNNIKYNGRTIKIEVAKK